MSRLGTIRLKLESFLVSRFLTYGEDDFLAVLRGLGVGKGDALMVHSSYRKNNGFLGRPVDMCRLLMEVVGPTGLLVMPSMAYTDSSKKYLMRGKPMNVRFTPSHMGLLSEVFRRNRDSVRSLSATHPLVAWGELADQFVAGHERAVVPFGEGSPFEKLYERGAKILCIDTGFESITFTHFVEDRIRDRIGVPLYEEDIYTGMVIDTEGRQIVVPTRVISDQAREARCEERYIRVLERRGEISRRRIGNTRLLLVNCKAMVAAAERMYREGDYFFSPPQQ